MGVSSDGASEDDLAAAHRAGCVAHPSIPLSRERYAAAVLRARGGEPPAAHRAGDFYLAAACTEGVEEAWRVLRETLLPRVGSFLRSQGASEAEASEICDSLPGRLWERVGGEGEPPRIGRFRGDSALFTWMAAVAVRLHRRLAPIGRGARAAATPSGLPDPAPTPFESALGAEHAKRLEAALHEAWGTLTPKECLAVLLKYRDGLPQKSIAAVLGVGEPRVSRLLEAGIGRLREEVSRRVRESPPGSDGGGAPAWRAMEDAVRREMARRETDRF